MMPDLWQSLNAYKSENIFIDYLRLSNLFYVLGPWLDGIYWLPLPNLKINQWPQSEWLDESRPRQLLLLHQIISEASNEFQFLMMFTYAALIAHKKTRIYLMPLVFILKFTVFKSMQSIQPSKSQNTGLSLGSLGAHTHLLTVAHFHRIFSTMTVLTGNITQHTWH